MPLLQCPCGNILIETKASGESVVLARTEIKLPCMSLVHSSSLFCLNCDTGVYTTPEAPFIAPSSRLVGPFAPSIKTSECFSGLVVKSADNPPLHFQIEDSHQRRLLLRKIYADFKQKIQWETDQRIKTAQAECAWLCDRIQEAEGVCESADLSGNQPKQTPAVTIPAKQPQSIILKEPVTASSPHHATGSLLTRHLSAGKLASPTDPVSSQEIAALSPAPLSARSASTPSAPAVQALDAAFDALQPAMVPLASTTATTSTGASSSSRKVHFKESTPIASPTTTTAAPAASASTPSISTATDATTSAPPEIENKALIEVQKQGGFSGKPAARSMPSPAAPGGAKIVFSKGTAENVFELEDEGESTGQEDEGHGKYLDETEEEDADDEGGEDGDGDDTSSLNVVLGSSLPVNIFKDARLAEAAGYERKPSALKPGEVEEFVAPHEIVARSFQQSAGMSGSVSGKVKVRDV
ncbi:hypothetical protein HDU98_011621 [Podochytrium sp. JEL0797]|nr:hypothetical protein HDU98_011621 [Podochytrium sp. JEL0797]